MIKELEEKYEVTLLTIGLCIGGIIFIIWGVFSTPIKPVLCDIGLFLALVTFYCIPIAVVYDLDHPQQKAIVALDLLLGWTFLGWVAALVWALTEKR